MVLTAFRTIFWIGLAFSLWLSLIPMPPAILDLASDPVKHALGWAILTLLSGIAYPSLSTRKLVVLLACANLVTELLQGLSLSGRDPEALDWIWGTLGILMVAVVVAAGRWKRSSKASPPTSIVG